MESKLRKTTHEQVVECCIARLRNSPPPDEVPDVADAFYRIFIKRGLCNEDSDRLVEAFETWRTTDPWFPTGADVLDCLPKPDPIHNEYKRLPNLNTVDPKQAKELVEGLKKIGTEKVSEEERLRRNENWRKLIK